MNFSDKIILTRKRNDELPTNNNIDEIKLDWSQELIISPTEDRKFKQVRKFVFCVLTKADFNLISKIYTSILSALIIGSVLEFVLETVYSLNNSPQQQGIFDQLELFFNIFFSIDYFAKILSCPNIRHLPRLLISPSWLIDLLSILPFYMELILSGVSSHLSSLRIIRIIRIFRIFRLLKASKNLQQVKLVFESINRSLNAVIMLFVVVSFNLFLFGTLVYFAEEFISTRDPSTHLLVYDSGWYNGQNSTFQSIPDAMYFTMTTMTTVGYGDMIPGSPLGKCLAAIAAITGILAVALPVTILSTNMSELYKEDRLVRQGKHHIKSTNKNKSNKKFDKYQQQVLELINISTIRTQNHINDIQQQLVSLSDNHDDLLLCLLVLNSDKNV